MKKSIYVRMLTALGGLALLCAAAGVVAEGFFGVPAVTALAGLLTSGSAVAVLAKLLLTAVLIVLACASVICALPPKKRRQTEFVMQKGENGAIGISVKAIEKQVRACIAKHDVIADAEVSIREGRDGLIILLDVDQVSGVNIPLSVGLLQKQVRQYVASCTGVDVQEVRVMVENNTTNVVASPFAVQDAVIPTARPTAEAPHVQPAAEPVPEPETLPEPEQEPAAEAPAAPAPVVIPEIPPMAEETEAVQPEDERPLHQRVFGAEEQPVFVPAPPELTAEPEAEAEEPEAAAAEEEAGEEELVIEAALEEILPQEAAEAGNAFTEAILAEEAAEATAETAEIPEEPGDAEAAEAEEEPQHILI